jgi:hypothetical protein
MAAGWLVALLVVAMCAGRFAAGSDALSFAASRVMVGREGCVVVPSIPATRAG